MITNLHYNYILVFLYSLFATYVGVGYFSKKLKKYGYLVEDKYKKNKKKIPTMAGLAMFAGVMIALALSQVLLKGQEIGDLFIFYFIVFVYAMYGVIDDLFSFKQRYDKIIVLFVLSLPIGSLISHDSVSIFGFVINLGGFLPYLLAPIYLMVVANLVNVYSGFNGQSSGLSLILLLAVFVKSYMLYGMDRLLPLLPMLGALIAFVPYNFYPARVIEGNVGQFMTGAAIGGLLIINELEIFGIVILIPHIVNFLLDTWILLIKKIPDVKFGSVRNDGTIIAPHQTRNKSIKFMLTYYFRMKERTAVLIMWAITIVFCMIGVVFF
jgi:UDP-N-acetylglucosamine--dolichyl-phosphate N-acetylglucosaminephosphotransferase